MLKKQRHSGVLKTAIAAALLVGLCGPAAAQEQEKRLLGRLIGKIGGEKKTEAADSTKVAREKKPLESYFFDDSLRARTAFAWTIRQGFNAVEPRDIDTLQDRFWIDYPFQSEDVGSAYLGNLGGAAMRLNYFERPMENADLSFLNAYDAYRFTPENVPYFNVKRPFTNLSWYMSGQTAFAEEQLRVTHAQNFSPSTGFNIYYLNRGTRGLYTHQGTKDKSLSLAFGHTGKRYSLFAGYIYNGARILENGGLTWDRSLDNASITQANLHPIRLSDARNEFRTNTFYLTQSFGIPLQRISDDDLSIADQSSFFIGHSLEYTTAWRTYSDTYGGTRFEEGEPPAESDDPPTATVDYYTDWFIDKERSLDSLYEQRLDNKVFLQIQPWNRDGIVGTIDGGIGLLQHRYYASNLHDEYIHGRGKGVSEYDLYLYGGVQGKLRRYVDWGAEASYNLAGHAMGDLRLDAHLQLSAFIKGRPITLTVNGSIDQHHPGYWSEYMISNHYRWDKPLNNETETRLEAKLEIPSIGLELGVRQSLTADKIYYGYEAGTIVEGVQTYTLRPQQNAGNTLGVTGVYLMKNFRIGMLHLDNRVLYQKSSNERVVPLPELSAQAAWYLDFTVVRDVMQMQIGVAGYYHTKYYAPGYDPALMQFHNQNLDPENIDAQGNERFARVGNYPYLDAFVTAKWKRMRIYAKFQHVNQGLFGLPEYFTVHHHPLNPRMFKLGFSWSFYD